MVADWIDDIGVAQWACICIVAVVALTVIIVAAADFINDVSGEVKYLNCEIRRTSGDERKFWILERRRLWLSWMPFVKR